jgi:hypothetical protein
MSGLGPQGRQLLDGFAASAAAAELTGESTIEEARDWLAEHLHVGERCPVCEQHARIYHRKLNSGIAYALILLYRAGANGMWVHKPTVLKGEGASARDESIARYWGLLEEETEVKRDDGGRAGYWRLTPRGVAFVRGVEAIPAFARIYNGKCLGLEGAPRTIRECLGQRFDYEELMSPIIGI